MSLISGCLTLASSLLIPHDSPSQSQAERTVCWRFISKRSPYRFVARIVQRLATEGCVLGGGKTVLLFYSSSRGGAKERRGPVSSFQLPLDLVLSKWESVRCDSEGFPHLPEDLWSILCLCVWVSGYTTRGLTNCSFSSLFPLLSPLTTWFLSWDPILVQVHVGWSSPKASLVSCGWKYSHRKIPGSSPPRTWESGLGYFDLIYIWESTWCLKQGPTHPTPPQSTLDVSYIQIWFHPYLFLCQLALVFCQELLECWDTETTQKRTVLSPILMATLDICLWVQALLSPPLPLIVKNNF